MINDFGAGKLVPGTYDSGISGCLREVRVLEGLLQRKMPAVSKHLKKRDVDLIAVVPQWFLSLFSQDFPFEVRRLSATYYYYDVCYIFIL